MMRFASFNLHAMCGVLLLSFATGCSTFYRSTSSQVAVNPAEGADVRILQDAWGWNEGFHYTQRGEGMAWLNLSNEESVHLIRLEQPGHFPIVHPVFPTSRNPLKSVDLGMTVGLATIGISADQRESPPPLFWSAVAGAAANLAGYFAGPKQVYEKSYFFPELKAIPTGNPANPPLRIEGFHMRIPEGQHSWHYFKNMEKYSANRVEFISASEESIEIEYSNLDEPLNATLQAQGFQSASEEGMFHRGEAIQLSGQLTSVEEHRVQNIVRYEIQTEWWIYNAFGLKTDTAKVSTQSNWTLYNFSNPSFDRDLIAEAVNAALFQALESPAFEGKLNRIEDLESEWTKSWETLVIDTPSQPVGKVAAAIHSVVTVAASDGHGSGCILSTDGYIVTNYHVIADGSLEYSIHFHDGSVLPATIVRYHPLHDLALLKVDTAHLTPFHIQKGGAIDVGEEAFALGTPYDIDLGASVTKGIISGKRKDGNRTLIQTDVSISPGNSGGALINAEGTLIGVVNEKVLGMGVEGIGFAIPAAVLSKALMLEFKH